MTEIIEFHIFWWIKTKTAQVDADNIPELVGLINVEKFDPDPFMKTLNKHGLHWHEKFDVDLEL